MSSIIGGSFAFVGDRSSRTLSNTASRIYVAAEVGEVCQLKCKHCIYSNERPKSPKPNIAVSRALSTILNGNYRPMVVSFVGKEPTIFPDSLLKMAEHVREADTYRMLVTNGIRLTGDLSSAIHELFQQVDVSLDGDLSEHDGIRGAGTFSKSWNNIVKFSEKKGDVRIGIISTASRNSGPSGDNINSIISLSRRLRGEFGLKSSTCLSISLYFGPPGDPMMLGVDEIVRLLRGLSEVGFPTRVLLTANYAHLWPKVAARLGMTDIAEYFDDRTGLPVIEAGNLRVFPFNQTEVGQFFMRLGNDGHLYLGCSHLALGELGREFALSTLSEGDLNEAIGGIVGLSHSGLAPLLTTDPRCTSCAHWTSCRGGDRSAGLYFGRGAHDPYCSILNAQVSPALVGLQ
ncbi:MAG: radical SAM protein [Alphaproteobacteria bacterium]